ncbi:MAG: hypothetical protein CSB44_05115 [Gammaproteobacteria bacterium]|nr:MAG: hypothetical protein CSB44_05115 [Gammaproteobacteria bacterium]
MNKLKQTVFLALGALTCLGNAASASERIKRPMHIHEVPELGLSIWTEYNPEWLVDLRYAGQRPVFLVQSPVNVYPPVSFSVMSFRGMDVDPQSMAGIVETAFGQGVMNYEGKLDSLVQEEMVAKEYGSLSGYEIEFSADVHGRESDVRVFLGAKEGHGPVLLQAHTPAGKMEHADEALRRSWENIDYL